MDKFYVTKKKVGNQGLFLYEVLDVNNTLIGKRTSTRTYVACAVQEVSKPGGSPQYRIRNWFGRKNLIGKGESGHYIKNQGVYIAELKEDGKDENS